MNKKTKWGLIICICISLSGGGLYTWIKNKQLKGDLTENNNSKKKGKQRDKSLNVNALIIRTQSMIEEISTTGSLIPDEEVDLSFETSGKLIDIYFTEGSMIKKGQLLAKINDKPLQAQLHKLRSQVKLAEDRVFRQNALLLKDAVSKEAYEQVKTDLASLNADIELIKANILQTELRAPFDGLIGLRQVSTGAYTSPSTIITKLTKISPLKIDFSVPERYSDQIKKGTKLTFNIDGKLNAFNASVYATESKVNPATRTLTVRALYPNANNQILPGRYAEVRIKLREIPQAIAIPTQAIVPEMGVDKVYLYKGGKAISVEVKTGLRTDSQIQIRQGLNIGDTLIISGTLQLRNGLKMTLDHID